MSGAIMIKEIVHFRTAAGMKQIVFLNLIINNFKHRLV